jgi:CHAT domain-containing protein
VLREKGRALPVGPHRHPRLVPPGQSHVLLHQPGDSQLSLFDLYQLDLPAELVTLSGCGTGLNVVVGGDELLGLVRGLLYAGAQGVLVTLWDVNDQSTAEFMKLFYGKTNQTGNRAKLMKHYAIDQWADFTQRAATPIGATHARCRPP